MILAIYDLSGIQEFIFSTNQLKDMIGGSRLVNQALVENIPELLREEPNSWKEGDLCIDKAKEAQIVYIGGGNALMLYLDAQIEKRYTRELNMKIFEQSGGALKLCSARTEGNEEKSLQENYRILMNKLDQAKKITPLALTARGLSINAHDNVSFEPILLLDEKLSTKSGHCKGKAFREYVNNEKAENDRYVNSFEDFRKEESKNMIAVIHIDGNTMGTKIQEFILAQKGSLADGLDALRKLSIQITDVYKKALDETVNMVYVDRDEKIPYRKIIADGDDITLICSSEAAFPIVELFLGQLEKSKIEALGDFPLSAAAGIAFANIKFPFYWAYDIAEQCCKNAKKVTLKREKEAKSSVDFHVCYSGVTGDLMNFRKENYIFSADKPYQLHLRPYIFGAKEVQYDYEKSFLEKQKMLTRGIARSKLMGLRSAYGRGTLEARRYGEFILARSEEKERETAQQLCEPLYDDGHAKYFDVLDVWDMVQPREQNESGQKGGDGIESIKSL